MYSPDRHGGGPRKPATGRCRSAPALRSDLEADHCQPDGRRADGAPGVGAQGHVHQAMRHSRSRATRRTAGDAIGGSPIDGRAEMGVAPVHGKGQLVGDGLADEIRAFIARLRGRPRPAGIDVNVLTPITMTVFVVLAVLTSILLIADIFNPVSLNL